MSCTPTTNPAPISVDANTTLYVSCVAHAAFYQQVILSFNQNMSSPVATFLGSGEGVPMLNNGQGLATIPTGTNTKLFAQFNFSKSGSQGPFQPAGTVCKPIVQGSAPNPVITSVTSEDATDNDDNDSYLTIIDLNATEAAVARKKAKGARG